MKLLSNNEIKNHKTEISKAIEFAEEIIICTAFLKYSGLKSLLELINQKTTKTIFFVGTNFYQTEPIALKQLFKDGHIIYLNRDKSPTFHPKIFLLRNQNEVKVFIGSANLTSGGLETNIETSIECNTTTESQFHNELIEQLEYFKTKSKRIETLETILDYEKRFEVYKLKHQIADEEFEIEEEKISEEERKREEERLRKIEEEKRRKTNPTSDSTKNRFAISDEYKKSWPIYFEEFKQFKTENNGNTIIPKTHKLYNWYKRQREFYNHLDENGVRAILPEHLELLNKENFFWGNPNEIIWMKKWENKLARVDAYCKSINQEFAWITVDKVNKQNPLNDLAQWCLEQRMRLRQLDNEENYKTKRRKITDYEVRRLKDIKFLTESENEGGKLKEDDFVENLIKLFEFKSKRLKEGNRKWLPSQTDEAPEDAELGGWLNDKIEWIKSHLKNGTQLEVAKQREMDFLELGIYVENGIRQSYFEFEAKEYLKMKKLYPIENPKGEERKPYEYTLSWVAQNKSRINTFPEWRQKRIKELGIVQ